MEILNSGSFVPLDNREKIDQLIHTARTLADEVGRTEGFQSSGQANHQLGLEMWKGAEYVCRAHEEANIRNLFLSKFLERLREIEKHAPAPTMTPRSSSAVPEPVQPVSKPDLVEPVQAPPPPVATPQQDLEPPQDKCLGVVPSEDEVISGQPFSVADSVPEYDADILAIVDRLDNEYPDPYAAGSSGQGGTETAAPQIVASDNSPEETTAKLPAQVEQSSPSELADDVEPEPESVDAASIDSIIIAENEPYNLDGCTITTVIQLLPENSGRRKCVLSLRTHDFAPMVVVSESGAADIVPHISAALTQALEQYRLDLPVKAAEKLKKEKPAAKKQSKTASRAVKENAAQEKETAGSGVATNAPAPAAAGTVQNQQGLFTS